MKDTLTVPKSMLNEIDALTRDLGLMSPKATVRYLLENAIARERKLLVARLYQDRRKTLRQCAKMLHVDLEEMIDILREFGIPFNEDLTQQLNGMTKSAA